MITAREAKRKATLNGKAKQYIDNIEKAVMKAVEAGETATCVHHNLTEGDQKHVEIMAAIIDQLTILGYSVEVLYADDLPAGCPTSQFDFNNGRIDISWA